MDMGHHCVSILATTTCLMQGRGHLISKFPLKFPDSWISNKNFPTQYTGEGPFFNFFEK